MTDTERAMDRLRAANPLPGDHVDADELGSFVSYFEERSDVMSGIKTIRRDETTESPRRRFRPAWVFAGALVAVLVVFGVTGLLIQGDEGPVSPTVPVVDSPQPTTLEPAPDVEPAPVSPEQSSRIVRLSDDMEYQATVGVGPDGLPVIASFRFDENEGIGTVRLFFCADSACEDSDVVEVAEEEWIGSPLELTVAPNGDIYMIMPGEAGQSVALIRNGEATALPAMFNWPYGDPYPFPVLPSDFMDDGRPVFVGPIGQTLTLVVCNDAVCESRIDVALDSSQFIHFPGMNAEGDTIGDLWIEGDTVRIPYAIGELMGPEDPESGPDGVDKMWVTKVATVTDLDSTPATSAIIANQGVNEIPIESTVAPDGALIVWLFGWQESGTPGEPLVTYAALTCSEDDCISSEAPGLGEWAWSYHSSPDARLINAFSEDIFDPAEYEAYLEEERRISEAGLDEGAETPDALGTNLVVAECVDTECTSAIRHTIDAQEGWWYLDSLDVTVGPDGTTYVLVGSSGAAGDPGLTLYVFPEGTLRSLVEPISGTAAIR